MTSRLPSGNAGRRVWIRTGARRMRSPATSARICDGKYVCWRKAVEALLPSRTAHRILPEDSERVQIGEGLLVGAPAKASKQVAESLYSRL